MNTKTFITGLTILFASITAKAQVQTDPDSLTHELQEIIVTAKQPATKLVGSTLVSSIPGSNLATLGNTLDVLAQLPMIKVQDDAVSVIGKHNLEIYINGRQMRDEQELRQILSSNLKKVELLMAPGAAYASTTDAVLRITTRRNFIDGLSATNQLQVKRRRKWSVMDDLDLSYRTGNLELFVNGSVNYDNSLAKGTTTNTLTYEGTKTVVGSSQNNSYPTETGVVKAGFNYAKDSQSAGAYYRYNPEHGDFSNSGTEWIDSNPALRRDIDKLIRAHSHLASVYYENTFANKYRIHFDGDFRLSEGNSSVATTYPESADPDVNSTDKRKSSLWAAKLYLDYPIWNGNFTIGTQDSYTHTKLDYHMLNSLIGEYIPSSLTDTRQTSAALFASWSRMFGKFSLSAGARYEYVDYDFRTDRKRDKDVSRRDHMLTPDISLGYTFNNDAQISLSYKMSTVKPPYSRLTGSLNYVGQHEIEGGNPSLRDERMHDIRLFGMWKDFILQGDLTRSLDTFAYIKELYPANSLQLLMHPVNIDVTALSLYLVWSKPVGCWTPNVTAGLYRQWLTLDNTSHNKPIFSYYFDNTFSLPHGWSITANMNGQTEGDMHTNRFGATWMSIDASVVKTFLNRSLTVRLSATDIFNTANNDWTMNTCGVLSTKSRAMTAEASLLA